MLFKGEVLKGEQPVIVDRDVFTHEEQEEIKDGIRSLQRRLDALIMGPEAGFDAAYLDDQVAVNQQAEAAHRVFSTNGENAIIRAVALGLLPSISQRISDAQALQAAGSAPPSP